MRDSANALCFTGVLLFLLGLVNGFAIPKLRSPRMGLSAHLTAVQCGTFLIAAGLLWPRLALAPAWSAALADTLWISLYVLWLALVLAALFGAGQGFVIAGQGMTTSAAKQALVNALLALSTIACTIAIVALLLLWRWRA